MREVWSNDPLRIAEEVERLIAGATEITFCQPGQPPRRLMPIALSPRKTYKMILLKKKEASFTALPKEGLWLYRFSNGPTRGFQATPILENEEELGVPLPHSIFWLQRRKHPRYATSNTNSVVTFTRQGSQHLNHGVVEDVCIEGARVTGPFSEHIREGDVLQPLCMTLRLRLGAFEEKITAAEAVVRRLSLDELQQQRAFGLHFKLPREEEERLEGYLAFRAAEDSVTTPPRT